MTSRCAVHFRREPSRPQLETPNVCERDEQERAKGRQRNARILSRGRGAAGQDDRPPDATARIRAHGNGESRERRVRIRGKQRDNGSHGRQQRSISERRERKPGRPAALSSIGTQRERNQTPCSGCWHFGWRHWWRNKRTTWTGLWEP